MVVCISGGGTGGHLKIADVFIDELVSRGIEVIYIGSTYGQDRAWFEDDDRIKERFFLDTSGVVNKKGFAKVFSLLNILYRSLFCLKIFKKYNIAKVISVGGFSAASASVAAILKKDCELFLHEQNSKIGTLNAKTLNYTTRAYSSFHNFSPIKDYPVAKEFFDSARLRGELKTVAFFGGSQGAVAINNFALKVAPKLKQMGINIIHQTGKNDFDRVRVEYEKLGIEADVFDFTKDILSKMSRADFCVSRAGASTLFELCANNLPTLFVPYKYAAQNHQFYNAKALVDQNLCFMQNEDELDEEYFFNSLSSDIKEMSLRLKGFIKPDGAKKIIDDILRS